MVTFSGIPSGVVGAFAALPWLAPMLAAAAGFSVAFKVARVVIGGVLADKRS